MDRRPTGTEYERESVPLADLFVLDLSDSVAGQFAGRQLADLGADVVLCEPADGSATRRITQLDVAGDDRESLATFIHLNAGKIASDVDAGSVLTGQGRPFERADWDVVITSSRTDSEALAGLYPNALNAQVTDFGADGPYADWRGNELVHQALSGSMLMNGERGRTPLYGVGHRASIAAGFELTIGVLATLFGERGNRPAASRVEASVHESAVAMEQNFSTQWAYSHTLPERGERFRPKGRLRCSDGHVVFFFVPERYESMLDTLGATDLLEDERFVDFPTFLANLTDDPDGMIGAVERYTVGRSVVDLEREAGARGLMLVGMRTIDDLRQDEHLLARDFWHEARCGGQRRTLLGPTARYSRSRIGRTLRPVLRTDGLLDEVTAPGCTSALRSDAEGIRRAAGGTSADTGPLGGVKVVDLTTAWAGPMATRLLVSLGAEVTKIEGPQRWDVWRGRADAYPLHQYPDEDTGSDPLNRNCWFNTQNHDKRSLVVDLKDDDGLAIAHALAERADVLIENYPDGTLDRLGLGYERLRELNPRLVVVHMSPYGSGGPLEGNRAFGPTMEALSGIAGLIGYEGEAPLGSGTAYLDPMGGLAAATATMAALHRVARDPEARGEYVEISQREAAMHWIGDAILGAEDGCFSARPVGNQAGGWSPHGAFATRGDDAWIAIAVSDTHEWLGLCELLDLPDLSKDRSLDNLAHRRVRATEIRERIGRRTIEFGNKELAFRLQERGVPAAPVANARDLFEDVHLRDRAWYQAVRHPTAHVVFEYPSLPILLDGERYRIGRHSPSFGQDSREIVASLNVSGDHLEALVERGVVVSTTSEGSPTAEAPRGSRVVPHRRAHATVAGPTTGSNQGDDV